MFSHLIYLFYFYCRNTSSASSDKESGMCQGLEAKHIHSSTPSVVLNSTNSSVSSLNNSNLKDDSFEKFADNQSTTDGMCNTSPGSISQESSLFPDNLSRSSESGKSVDLNPQKTPESHASKSDVRGSEENRSVDKKQKKRSSWYNVSNSLILFCYCAIWLNILTAVS